MLLALILLSLFFTMLLFPETVFQGACDGLLLWYQILIPTLFPYLIVTGLLLKTDGAAVVSRLLFRPFHLLFGTSFYGSFAVLSGFLCGYPMGAKIIADLLLQGKISLEERGDNGFGYDSIFIPDGFDKTFAEMSHEEKNQISHRSRALKNLRDKISNL